MPVYQRRTRIVAPFERVWEFHSNVSRLEALILVWIRLDIESVRGPSDSDDPDELVAGTEIEMSMRPFGVSPHQRWISRILDREAGETTAWFRDDMVGDPFSQWVHIYRFVANGGETIVEDRVEYELLFGLPDDLAGVLGGVSFERMFRTQHVETERLLEER